MSKKYYIFDDKEKQFVEDAIAQAELNTSGEIKVHIENDCRDRSVLDRASNIFSILQMNETKLRNGVLFYMATNRREFAIFGDKGINAAVPSDFWQSIILKMETNFKKGKFDQGFVDGILMAGDKLREHFPYQSDDVNELPDQITFGEI